MPPLQLATQTSMMSLDRQYVRPEPHNVILKRIQPGARARKLANTVLGEQLPRTRR